jgi:uncharacterized protein YigA (DUF484 family)
MPENEAPKISSDAVKEYLKAHPEFLLENPEILASLSLAESPPGVTSLVARQQKVMRTKIKHLDADLTQLLSMIAEQEEVFHVQWLYMYELLQAKQLKNWMETAYQMVQMSHEVHHITVVEINNTELENLFKQLNIAHDFVGQMKPSQSQRLFDHSLGSAVLMGFIYNDVQYVLGFGHMNDKYFSLETDRFLFDLLRLILSHMLTFLHREL